ncbi:glycosyltransferase family 2 protein [Lachnospiraceae bacterium MD1]|jgi:dolichol-phosphate mannosyltransferase|uniref:Glycosyltransferase family 2 protein n=1 Tax=Variimorphobacter saccharofermentans TaxID=2755051 RepID=A0A839K1P9_9FIRM|nr:glycosyltransferase family 2 protein [Variimorphobacter saccharofermentans]MBB2183664.1 glycosyltransferase family 2 protein [Variimorphobacter saccharofermentans]
MVINEIDRKQNRSLESKLSLVIPIYQEGSHIRSSIGVIESVLIKNNLCYEFILVDDGSKDNTWSEISQMAKDNVHISALRLSRNFGKESALCAGLEYADGDMVLVMDADLQHPPELIPEMVQAWREGDYDVVEGVKKSRGKENLIYHLCAKFFYYVIYRTADINLGRASDFKLLDRRVVDAWKEMPERAIFFRGMSAWLGYDRKQIEFDVAERVNGKSKWSFLRLIRLAVNAITSYTSVPLHCITILGIIMFVGTIVLGIQTLYMKFTGKAMDGFTTVILLQLLIGSSIMVSLGMIGIYLTKIYKEVKNRPRYLISKCIRGGEKK